jgi:hypothetical protein
MPCADCPLAGQRQNAYAPAVNATLSEPIESLLREQVENGQFSNIEDAIASAVKTVFGRTASPTLEALLDEALSHPGERIPLSQLRRKAA